MCSGFDSRNDDNPARSLGMTNTCAGDAGLISSKARRSFSSLTIEAGMSPATILSKIVSGAASRTPAIQMVSHRPLASHCSRAPCTSSYTLAKSGSPSFTASNHAPILGGRASFSGTSNLGSMYFTNTIVGNSVASARDTSLPHRYKPSVSPPSSIAPSMMPSCFLNSATASFLIRCIPNGYPAGLYRHPCTGATYTSCNRAMRFDRGSSGRNDGPTSL
mmetsp:Transcript_41526/g.125843  ORF Transcript_41526/g.125843 Transcript_41526/m.125843 type:complete len:219 (+) Transcript_41526:429-1085(+)